MVHIKGRRQTDDLELKSVKATSYHACAGAPLLKAMERNHKVRLPLAWWKDGERDIHNTVGHILSKGAAWFLLRESTGSAVGQVAHSPFAIEVAESLMCTPL